MAVAFTFSEVQIVWKWFVNFRYITTLLFHLISFFSSFHSFLSGVAALPTQTRLHMSGSTTLEMLLLFIRALLNIGQFVPQSLHPGAITIHGKLQFIRPRCQSRSDFKVLPRRSYLWYHACYLIIYVCRHIFHVEESVFTSIPLQKSLYVFLSFWQMLKTDQSRWCKSNGTSLRDSKAAGAEEAYAVFPAAGAAVWRALWDRMWGACSTLPVALKNVSKSVQE